MNKKGFTLVELMVVVLIIAILAAIAVPQYEKSIERAHFAEARTLTKSYGDAIQRYINAARSMPDGQACDEGNTSCLPLTKKELDVEIPRSNEFSVVYSKNNFLKIIRMGSVMESDVPTEGYMIMIDYAGKIYNPVTSCQGPDCLDLVPNCNAQPCDLRTGDSIGGGSVDTGSD